MMTIVIQAGTKPTWVKATSIAATIDFVGGEVEEDAEVARPAYSAAMRPSNVSVMEARKKSAVAQR